MAKTTLRFARMTFASSFIPHEKEPLINGLASGANFKALFL
jgi:hypothetical protein